MLLYSVLGNSGRRARVGKNGGRLGIWVRFQDDAGRRRDRDGSILRPAPFSAAAIGLPAWVARESFVVRSMLTFV